MVSTVDKDIVLQVDIRSVEGEVVAVRRVSRIQKEDELLQKAMRKKSRKVGGVIMKLRVDFRLKLYIYYRCRGRGTGWCSLRRWGCSPRRRARSRSRRGGSGSARTIWRSSWSSGTEHVLSVKQLIYTLSICAVKYI